MQNVSELSARITKNMYIGDVQLVQNTKFLHNENITAIINLSGKKTTSVNNIDIFDFVLSNQELMDVEFPKMISKLEMICQTISELVHNNRNFLICCLDGKNKSPLTAGYYLIKYCREDVNHTISRLETIYYSPDILAEHINAGTSNNVSDNLRTAHAERRTLTMSSFRRILRLIKN